MFALMIRPLGPQAKAPCAAPMMPLATLPMLRELHPHLRVPLATGMADQHALDLTRAFEPVDLLAKPFNLKKLQRALARWH